MDTGKWQRKVDALVRLAEDQRGKPEGNLARFKLLEILKKHPEVTAYEPFIDLVRKDITMKDIGQMQRQGISTDGSWTAGSFAEALAMMKQEYRRRIEAARAVPKALLSERLRPVSCGLEPTRKSDADPPNEVPPDETSGATLKEKERFKMKVKVYCGCFTGAPHWHGTEAYEPDECCWEDVVEVDKEEWQEGYVSVTCPACGAELCQIDDHFEDPYQWLAEQTYEHWVDEES